MPLAARIIARLNNAPLFYRLARGAFWSLLGTFVSRILTFSSTIIVARLLGKDSFGEMGMVQSTLGMFGVFAGFGLGTTAIKFIAEFHHKDVQKTGRIIVLTTVVGLIFSSLFSVLCLFSSPWLATNMLNRPDLVPLLTSGAILLFISTMNGVMSAALTGFEAFKIIAKINIWQAALVPLLTIPLVWVYGVQGAICSMTINASLGLIFCTIALKNNFFLKSIPIQYSREIWNEWPILWNFSLPSMMSALMMAPATWITNAILVNQPNGYGELGLFTAANQWRNMVIIIPGLLSAAILPVLSEAHGKDDKSDFRKTVAFNIHITWIVALPLTVLVIFFGNSLATLFGKQFYDAGPIIVILMVACFLNIVNGAVGSALAGSGRMWTGTFMNLGWAFALILSSLILIPLYKGLGLALAFLLAYLLHTMWVMFYVEKELVPSLISEKRSLIALSLTTMSLSIWLNIKEIHSSLISIFLVSLSCAPLLFFAKTNYRNLKLDSK